MGVKLDPGKAFERYIASTCDGYRRAGVANIWKVDPPTRIVRKGKSVFPIQLANPFLDFVGSWDGRTVMFEAKTTAEPSLRLRSTEGGGISPKQLEALREWHSFGAAVFVVWAHGGGVRLLTLPAIEIFFGVRASVPWAGATVIHAGAGLIECDFLRAFAALDGAS